MVAVAVIVAPIIGPTLGGWITDTYSWRWIFLINIPVGIFTFFAVLHLVEDPPWVKRDRLNWRDLDYVGITLIAIGLGCLEVMLDRGEEEDWFGSPFIRLMAALTVLGISSAIVWLLYAKGPVVDLRVFADRNFAVGSIVVVLTFSLLYGSAVLIPQLAQQRLGYTATWAGLILSPGGLVVLMLIPVVSRLFMPHMQTRYIIGIGIFSLAAALAYATRLTPTMSFYDLVALRAAQTFGLAFLFVPNSTITYSTLPKSLNTDASSLYVMLRNISGSVGISLSTAMVQERTQVHRAYLAGHLTPYDQPYNALVQHLQSVLTGRFPPGVLRQTAEGLINLMLTQQAAILAYIDVFALSSALAFCMIPIVFLFRGSTARAPAAGAAH